MGMVHSLTACGGFNRANRVPGREEGPRARGKINPPFLHHRQLWSTASQPVEASTEQIGCQVESRESKRQKGRQVERKVREQGAKSTLPSSIIGSYGPQPHSLWRLQQSK